MLAASGFMAFALADALLVAGLAPLLVRLPPLILPLLVPAVLIATGQLGLNPVAVVALLGAAVPDPTALGVPPAALAFAFMLSFRGLGVGMIPMSASAITTARWSCRARGPSVRCGTPRSPLLACCSPWAAIIGVYAARRRAHSSRVNAIE